MPPLARRAWRLARRSKAAQYALLLLGPMLIQPRAFIKQPGQPQPLYARLSGLWATPFIVAGIFALVTQSFYQWIIWSQASKADATQPATYWIRQLHETQSWSLWGGFTLALALIYVLATIRWGYHCGMITLLSRWKSGLSTPPLIYFVVTTAAFGMWLSLFYLALSYGLWQWDTQENLYQHLSKYSHAHQTSILAALLIIGTIYKIASHNSDIGRKALYGGSRWLCFTVDLISIALLMTLALVVSHI